MNQILINKILIARKIKNIFQEKMFCNVDFGEFQKLVEQCNKEGIMLQEQTKKHIEEDIKKLSSTCPCGEDGICLNIKLAVPIIESRYGLSSVNNSVIEIKSLLDDVKTRHPSRYEGKVVYFQGEACGFFLVNTQNVILRFLKIGNFDSIDMFALFLDNESECYIYTHVDRIIVEKASGLLAKEQCDLSVINVMDHSNNKKLFQLSRK
jgi:hypothetical protein